MSGDNMTVFCWTHGQKFGSDDGDRVWLWTDKDCYVPQYDLEYSGPAEEELNYCGEDSEEKDITREPMRIKYHAECDLNPNVQNPQAVTKYYPAGTDILATCWTNSSETVGILGDTVYVKTTDDCFTGQAMLTHHVDLDDVPNCGPLARREVNRTSTFKGRSLPPVPEPVKLQPRYLINVTVGEDWAKCHELPSLESPVVRAYPWDRHIIIQCTSPYYNGSGTGNFGLTTDFCYVSGDDIWQSIMGDYIYMPRCSNFGVP
ncbi:uncharacterized protein BP5553_04208 [Venustampulla echinocandica]|uniref:Uncharacterized protein n=1 Tax=Venustampulla echinocandica TaxID=2656787 RepID=A0A370TWL8_9HELO|nr:uncharacterized protein BP5553_04208 [Venustampulla echinocandica]RDL39868.1 hypothetical protein BP5553_04208 [Venustampulla echinocandica]